MEQAVHDLIVLGAGPGGYVAAIRAAQLGRNVACIEREPALGGTCLRVGCIPSKALLESSERFAAARDDLAQHGAKVTGVELDLPAMMRRKERIVAGLTKGVESLFRKHGVTRYRGQGLLLGAGRVAVENEEGATELRAERILVATGSVPIVPAGIELDGDRVGTSTEALSFSAPPKHLVVIGAGYIGLELGCVWRRLGSRVTVIEFLDRILPGMDAELASEALKQFRKQGLEFRLSSRVLGARAVGEACQVECQGQEPLACDRVLVAVGRRANTTGIGLETVGAELDERGRIRVDGHYATTAEGVYAIGDCVAGPMLAHKAEDEGIACVEAMFTGHGHVNYLAIPGVVYTHPEIATVGRTEEELNAEGIPYHRGSFPFAANGRAKALGETEGFVKVLAHAETDRILGVHVIGPRAGDLIAEAAAAIEFGASSEDLARCCHAHPTLAEALKEASLAVAHRAIHF